MEDILADFSAPVLTQAIEANNSGYLMDLDRSPQVTIHKDPELTWFIIGAPFPGFNRIVHTKFEAHDLETKIEAALSPFKSRGVPMLWHTGPATRPADLGECLVACGLTLIAAEPGMAADLSGLEDDVSLPSGLKIEHVRAGTLKAWGQAATRAFEFPEGVGDAMVKIEASLGPGQHPARHLYVGFLEGEPVATALLFLGTGVAGLYGIGTVPEARRQGIGRAMTVVPLLEARAMGYRIGVLHASPMGEGIYRRLGFREYCTLARYAWRG